MQHEFWKHEALFSNVFVRRELAVLVQDLAVGSLLSFIVYWHKPKSNGESKGKIKKDDKEWIVNSRDKMMAACCLTRNQYIRAVKVLVELGFIEYEMYGFKGKVHPFIRLNEDALLAALVCKPDNGLSENQTTVGDLCLETGQPNKESTKESLKENATTVADSIEDDNMSKASEVMAVLLKKKVDPGTYKATVGSVSLLWKAKMGELYKAYQKDLTGKEAGQLKQSVTFLMEGGCDPRQAVAWSLENWPKFVFQVGKVKGFSTGPTVPQVGYLLNHREVLRAMFVQSIAPKKVEPPVMKFSAAKVSQEDATMPPVVKPKELTEDVAADLEFFAKAAAKG